MAKEEMTRPQNMDDIAQILGISKMSVSLALRKSPRVSQKLRNQVQQLVQQTGFIPRSYRSREEGRKEGGAPRKVAVMMLPETETDPVIQTIRAGVTRRLNERNIPFELVDWHELAQNPNRMDAFSGVIFDYATLKSELPKIASLPQVVIMYEELDIGPWDSFKPEERLAGKLAAKALLDQGFRKVVAVWEKAWTYQPEENERLRGFRQEIRSNGATCLDFGYDRTDISAFCDNLRQLLSEQGTTLGIFAFCDQIAYRVCATLEAFGLKREPGKLQVVSCDNTYYIHSLYPALPVVDLHIAEVASQAVDGLLWRMEFPGERHRSIHLEPELILPPPESRNDEGNKAK